MTSHAPIDSKPLGGLNYCVVDENDCQGFALVDVESISFQVLDQKSFVGNAGQLLGSLVWKKDVPKRCSIVYFQGRKKLIAFADNEAWIMDVRTGFIDSVVQCTQLFFTQPICVLQDDCIQNKLNHNALPYSEYSVILVVSERKSYICSFDWASDSNKPQIKVTKFVFCNNFAYCGGKVWYSSRTITLLDVDLENLTWKEHKMLNNPTYVQALVHWKAGVFAFTCFEVYMLNCEGQIIKSINKPWNYGSAIYWQDKLVCTCAPNWFSVDDQEYDNQEHHSLFVLDTKTGITFNSKWKKESCATFLFVSKNVLYIFPCGSQKIIQYRGGMLSY